MSIEKENEKLKMESILAQQIARSPWVSRKTKERASKQAGELDGKIASLEFQRDLDLIP